MSLSKEPTMKEWLESLRARNNEQQPTSNHLPSYSQITAWLLDAQTENDRLQAEKEYKDKITAELVEQRDALQKENTELKEAVKGLSEQRQKDVKIYNDLLKEENQSARVMEKEITDLKRMIDIQRVELVRHVAEKEQLKTDQKTYRDELLRRAQEIERLGSELDKIQQQLTEKIEKSPEYNNILWDLSKLRKEHEELQAVEKNQRDTQGYHKTVLENVKATLAKRDAEVTNLRQEIDRTAQKAVDMFNEKQATLNERDRLKFERTGLRQERDKLAGRIGALQQSNNELGRKYQLTVNRYNKLLERVKTMELATKLKVPSPGESVVSVGPPRHEPVTFNVSQTCVKPHTPEKTMRFAEGYSPVEEPKPVSQVWDGINPPDIGLLKNCTFSPPGPKSAISFSEYIDVLFYETEANEMRKTIEMLQFNLEHQTNTRLAKEKELAELRKTVYELQKATRDIEYEYMEPARSGKDFVTYFAFEARSPKDTPTGRRRISF